MLIFYISAPRGRMKVVESDSPRQTNGKLCVGFMVFAILAPKIF